MTMITSNLQLLGAGTTNGLQIQPALDSAGNAAKLAFFGGTPGVQLTGSQQGAITRGSAGGMIATFSFTNSPASVTVLSTGEYSMTVVGAVNAQLSPATTDVLYINKPTAQAGLGIGNVRGSAANTLGVTFSALSGTNFLTPTGSQVYGCVALRGFGAITTVLTPASVALSTCVEQTFTVTGVRAGELIQVSKPTSQAGLDIVGCRAVSNNVIGITFMNVTAGPLTPTAAETYRIISLGGMDAINNDVMFQITSGTIASVLSTGTMTIALAVSNVALSDMVVGVSKPSYQAGLAIGSAFVTQAGAVNAVAIASNTAPVTPTASEAYYVQVKRPAPVAPLVIYSQTLTPASIAANTTAEQSFTVTGIPVSTAVWVNKPSAQAGIGIAGVRVTGVNNIGINFCNPTAGALTPAAETYIIGNFQMPIDQTGNAIIQSAILVQQQTSLLANAVRAALVQHNLIAGV